VALETVGKSPAAVPLHKVRHPAIMQCRSYVY